MSLGEALAVTRRARAMSQETLAAAAGITQAALSRYENDLRVPAPGTLAALAEALGVTVGFLERPGRAQGAYMVDAHMRRRHSAEPAVWRRLEACLSVCRMHLDRLGRAAEIEPALVLPLFDPAEHSPPEAARLTRMQWRMPSGPVRGLVRWLESAGCVIVEQDFGPGAGAGRADVLSQWAADAVVMLANRHTPTDRLRLALAHELGHVCMHSAQLAGDPEDEADAFAAEILMPGTVIGPELHDLDVDKLAGLKRCWGVPMTALIERARQLGRISAGQRQHLCRSLPGLGRRDGELFSDELAPEQPSLALKLGQTLLDSGLSAAEVAAIAGASPGGGLPFLPGPRPGGG